MSLNEDLRKETSVIQQVHFLMPQDIRIGLLLGEYKQFGGVIRYASGEKKGQIVEHLKTIDYEEVKEQQEAKEIILQAIKDHKVAVAIGAIGILAISGIGVYIVVHEPKYVKNFRSAASKYIDEIQNANLTVETIDLLMDSIEELKTHKRYKKKLSIEYVEVLVNYINQYTIELLEKNNVEYKEKELTQSDDCIINLENYLKEQHKLFEKAM